MILTLKRMCFCQMVMSHLISICFFTPEPQCTTSFQNNAQNLTCNKTCIVVLQSPKNVV